MIPPKVKALFQFIEYLHSNIENFNQYNDLIKDLEKLNAERWNLQPERNYKEKIQFNNLQAEIDLKFPILREKIEYPIKAKAKELEICNFNNEPIYSFNGIEDEIRLIKENPTIEDLPEILKYKNLYIQFRNQTHKTFLTLQVFFIDLDRMVKDLFDFFKDTDLNEFENFESKPIQVNSLREGLEALKNGQTSFTLPDDWFFNPKRNTSTPSKALPPQQKLKQKPELNEALISFSKPEIIEALHNELKGYFKGNETELKRALEGEQLKEFLLFPHNQNKFVEVFKRLKYNGFLLSTPKEIKDWICSNFTYQYKRVDKKEVREFSPSTVHDILTKDKGEPTKKERICTVDWLPYKNYLTRQNEAEKENI